LASSASIFLAEVFGLELPPETIFGVVAAVAAYVGVEGMIDRGAAKAAVESQWQTAYQQLQAQAQVLYNENQELKNDV
jgi:hypothetical protein